MRLCMFRESDSLVRSVSNSVARVPRTLLPHEHRTGQKPRFEFTSKSTPTNYSGKCLDIFVLCPGNECLISARRLQKSATAITSQAKSRHEPASRLAASHLPRPGCRCREIRRDTHACTASPSAAQPCVCLVERARGAHEARSSPHRACRETSTPRTAMQMQ